MTYCQIKFEAPLILKSDSFWFTSVFMFLAGSWWVVVGGGVACVEGNFRDR